jgi:hypothetical protein
MALSDTQQVYCQVGAVAVAYLAYIGTIVACSVILAKNLNQGQNLSMVNNIGLMLGIGLGLLLLGLSVFQTVKNTKENSQSSGLKAVEWSASFLLFNISPGGIKCGFSSPKHNDD